MTSFENALKLLTLAGLCLLVPTFAQAENSPIPVKAVVVAMFERGTVDDGNPGEFELWVQNEKLDQVFPFPMGWKDHLRMNDKGVLGVATGVGVTNATATIMALGMDPRFDLSKAYWIVAGIAGGDPHDVSLASAAWAEYVVDGDLIHEIEGREIPDGWPYGKMALSGSRPNERKSQSTDDVIVHKLNPSFVNWAYELTKDTPIPDGPEIAAFRKQFEGYPNAVKPPFVMIGDAMGSSTYWHGDIFNQWANDWVKLYSDGKGNFVMTAMEDNGTATALMRLDKAGRVDFDRLLVLRTASNYSTPPPGESASWHISADYVLGGRPAIESAYQVGCVVLHEILANWKKYQNHIPGE
jgi:purine nucleoside permease